MHDGASAARSGGDFRTPVAAAAVWRRGLWLIGLVLAACHWPAGGRPAQPLSSGAVTAIVGVTVIDGTGAKPRPDATVLLQGRQIVAVGARRHLRVPPQATVIDGRGLFVLPGFIDAGVHLTRYFGPPGLSKALFGLPEGRTAHRQADSTWNDSVATERAAAALQYGVTTVRDARGMLPELQHVRNALRDGRLSGARVLMAGPVLGSAHGNWTRSGHDLVAISADSLRRRINQYLDQDVDFLMYSGTLASYDYETPEPAWDSTGLDEAAIPPLIVFSDRAQRAIVEEAHRRGIRVETHAASPDGLRAAVLAGVDLVQHPEVLRDRAVMSAALAELMVRRRVICALQPRVSAAARGSSYWQNARLLIQRGCLVVVMSGGSQPGRETLDAIEGLATLGMTPMAAIVAATRNGALASNMSEAIGTLEPGKLADLVVLRADPLQEIKNIEQIAMVFKEGIPYLAGPAK